jgi:hypothetical protein
MNADYHRGYYAGSKAAWPAHRPPQPPNVVVCKLLVASQRLRDEADSICSKLTEDDEFAKKLAPAIDEVDLAMMEVTKWLREGQ